MNYKETLEYIHSLDNFTLPAGMARIKEVLKMLGNPQDNFKAIHIAGTNGKGSVSAMLSSVFASAGYKTGLFISPFIIDFRERIQINGEYISENNLIKYAKAVMDTKIRLTEFEFITAVAFLYFAEQKIDILICETGLGGRLDATNVIDNKIVSVITKIGLDHTAVLGDSIEKIANEKCGILRKCPTVTTPHQNPKALQVIKQNAQKLSVPDLNQLEILETDGFGNTFIYKGLKYTLSLCGEYQIENALVVLETLEQSGYDIPYDTIYKALNSTYFPARMEMVSKEPLIVIDGAHNPDGAAVLAKELRKLPSKAVAIIGMMMDKDVAEFLKTTLCHCKAAVSVEVEGLSRSLGAEELCSKACRYCDCFVASGYSQALNKANKIAKGAPVFVFGSLYLAAGVRKLFKTF